MKERRCSLTKHREAWRCCLSAVATDLRAVTDLTQLSPVSHLAPWALSERFFGLSAT